MKNYHSLGNRILAVMLSVVIVLGMLPASVFAVGSSTLTTDIGEKDFLVGETTEFTFTTTANDDANTWVLGTFEFSDPSAVAKLEYLEAQTGKWFEFYGDFGPATGFPMTDATSRFRVSFNKAGTYTVKASMVTAGDRTVLCSVEETVSVRRNASVLTTDMGSVPFVVGEVAEFTFTTTANDDANTLVLGTFEFSDPSAVAKLEYLEVQTGKWFEFYGDFGPATGFPMTDATSRFRVSFNKAGTYTVKASMVTAGDRTVLCSVEETVSVRDVKPGTLTTNIGDLTFLTGKTAEFTFTTTANDDANTLVLGSFEFSDPSAVAKLEYLEVQTGKWFEFYGDFGPATGFPMTDATSRFRVSFNKAGTYTVKASMVTAGDRTVLCSVEETVSVRDVKPGTLTTNIGNLTFITGKTAEFTFTTTANDDANTLVLGTFEFSDPSAVAKLEYLEVQTGKWFEFYGDFGPATGFPMTDATSRFRVSFNKAGTYMVKASMVTAGDRTVLCSATETVSVRDWKSSVLTTNIGSVPFVVGKTAEFTFTTTANDDADTLVLGSFEFSDPSAIAKLEYRESQTGKWFEFNGDFGPATGFPMTDATSRFRVTFKKVGIYTVKASMVTAGDRKVLSSVMETVSVADTSKLTTDIDKKVFITGQTQEFTFTTIANSDANTLVLGTFEFSDPSAIAKLEYLEVQTGKWFEFYGSFGPATGFPMTNATSCFRVSFNKAGTYTVKAAMKTVGDGTVLCSVTKDVKVNLSEQTGFAFKTPDPVDQWVGAAFHNEAQGGQTNNAIIYEIVEGPATISDDGTVSFTGLGKVIVKATRPGNDFYKEVSATYVVTSILNTWSPFGFENSNPTVTYQSGLTYPNAENKNDLAKWDEAVTFAIVDGEKLVQNNEVARIDAVTGVLTILKAGTVTVRATRNEDNYYLQASAEYTLTVEKADQTIAFEKVSEIDELTYQPESLKLPEIIGRLSEGELSYDITKGKDEVAKIDDHGNLQLLKSGDLEMTIIAAGDDCYHESNLLTWKVTVKKAQQTGFGFAAEGDVVTYNDVDKNAEDSVGIANEYTLITDGGQTEGLVTYQVVQGDAAVFEKSGVLKIQKSGTVKVKAVKAGDECYEEAIAYFDLKVEKANQSFTFAHDKNIQRSYGLSEYQTKIITSALNSGVISYAVSENTVGAAVDSGTGVVSFSNSAGKVGSVTVTVTMVGNDCYHAFSDSYTITLDYEHTSDTYTLQGEKISPDSQWFIGDVKILAPDGYEISYHNDLTDNQWTDFVVWTTDGEKDTWSEGAKPVVYLKNIATGAITDAIFVSDLKRDTVKPNGLQISYEADVWATILEKLFGFNAADVKVTVSAADSLSGIGKMEYSLNDGDTYTEIVANNGEYEFTVPPQYRGQLWLRATDVAGNAEVYKHLNEDKEQILIVDHTEPGLTVCYQGGMDDAAVSGIRHVNNDKVTVLFEITDENFDLRGVNPIVSVNNERIDDENWLFDNTSGKLEVELCDEGDYVIKAKFTDRLNRKVDYESEVRIDRTNPVIASKIENGKHYTEEQTLILEITEHNFDATNVTLVVHAVDSMNNPVLTDDQIKQFAVDAKNPAKWVQTEGTDVYTLALPITEDGNYTVTVDCTDKLGWADSYICEFTLDQKNPIPPTLEYKTVKTETILGQLFGFSKETVRVTITTGDATSGVDYIAVELAPAGPNEATDLVLPEELEINADASVKSGNVGSISNITVTGSADNLVFAFDIPAQFRGTIAAEVYDKATRSSTVEKNTEHKTIVVDNIAPEVQIEFAGGYISAVKADDGDNITRATMTEFDGTTRFIYNSDVTATIKVKEANFFREIDMPITVIRDGQTATTGFDDSGWSDAPNSEGWYIRTIKLEENGDYRILVNYQDHSSNKMEWSSNECQGSGTGIYQSNIHTVDTVAPKCEVTYSDSTLFQTLNDREYYNDSCTATIKITDRNFRPDEVTFVSEPEIADAAKNLKSWSAWKRNGDEWTAEVVFAPSANYSVSLSYHDLANNKMGEIRDNGEVKDYTKEFTVDNEAPTDLKVTYRPKKSEFINKILDVITFGYYKAEQEVVLTMVDAVAGIEYVELTVIPEGPACATDLKMPEKLVINADGSVRSGDRGFIGEIKSEMNGGNLNLSFDVPAQFRGKVSFVAYDKSGNSSSDHKDPGVLVVDTIKPGHTVSYNPSNVVNTSDMKDKADFDPANGITATEKDAYVLYFNTDAVAKIEIAEANFDPTQVSIIVFDGKGNAVTGWKQTDWITTVGKPDTHTKTLTITQEGDYRIKVFYQDYSENEPVEYLSQRIVVDKTAPVIDVKYSNTDIKNTIDNRDYFAETQKATVTIKEHNFRADDVVIKVTAKNVVGSDVLSINDDGTVTAYAKQGTNRDSWTAYEAGTWRVKDDTFVITLNYTADANYTFDIEYQDLAKNKAADYARDEFTVDVTAPKNLTVNYSTSFFEQVKQLVTFGYYNARMTVTITAEDETSGIYHFAYSYIKGKNVSGVNAQLLDQAIREAEITYQGKKATATFHIPKMVLGNDNQFNGTVEFTAYDRSENNTQLKDSKVIVVDNISPTSKVTYNAPVQTVNGTSYYNGNINASVVINEANFDANDVVVSVTQNNKTFPLNVSWQNNSVDTHTGSFTLTQDGDYIVSVQYKDKSGNQMAAYTSNKLTLDTQKPTVKASNIKANTANKDEKYGFVITVDDINLDTSAIKLVLKTVVKQEDGKYATAEIDLGQATTVVKGKTYSYTVENLPDDGLYTLTCEVKDMSANTMTQIVLDDGQSYEQVQFSINRKGSVFAYGNEFTSALVEQYYIYSVAEDLVVVEVNVDPIEQYKVTLNGRDLIEGTDYTTEQTSKNGEWSKRTYTVKKELFEKEGEYNIIVSSTDKASTTAFSDVKDLAMAFVVDQTKPVLVITGLESGGRYRTTAQTVTLIPTDEGGRLNRLSVVVLASDGTPLKDKDTNEDISVRFEMSGDELLKHLEENDGKITFTIPNGLNHKVQITCNDCAQHDDHTTNEYAELFNRVTVSDNGFVILFANTYVFVGLIAGLLALIVLLIVLITKSKKKKK